MASFPYLVSVGGHGQGLVRFLNDQSRLVSEHISGVGIGIVSYGLYVLEDTEQVTNHHHITGGIVTNLG